MPHTLTYLDKERHEVRVREDQVELLRDGAVGHGGLEEAAGGLERAQVRVLGRALRSVGGV